MLDQIHLHPAVSVSIQLRTLDHLFRQLEIAVAEGHRPVIEIDLDLCALRPGFRTKEALKAVGREFGIQDWSQPEKLSILPGYSDEAWLEFVDFFELEKKYSGLTWTRERKPVRTPGTPFARFHELYWKTDLLIEDEPTPGLGGFVHKVEAAGGRVVFLSGRWLKDQVEPTRECLRRAGIPDPNLIIGNPWHETLVHPGQVPLSDSAVKAWRQDEVLRHHGLPIAIVDDRLSNREAIQNALKKPVLGIGIAIPGFTADQSIHSANLRLSTFETFDSTIDSAPVRLHLQGRYPGAGQGLPWKGLYAGLGRSGLPYVIPRLLKDTPLPQGEGHYVNIVKNHKAGTLTEESFLDECQKTIPPPDLGILKRTLEQAKDLASQGIAAPFPQGEDSYQTIWLSLVCAWLHSRDMDIVMDLLGYPIPVVETHDLHESVSSQEIKRLLIPSWPPDQERVAKAGYSDWIIRWAKSLGDEPVNVSFLNPALVVDLCTWSPNQKKPQDAMDVHRLSDHHEGDRGERFDPLEAGINNLLHQREGRHGVRKEPVESWTDLKIRLQTETGASDLAKNSLARQALRDAAEMAQQLEEAGWLTPWYICKEG